jgi:hypothetical protein
VTFGLILGGILYSLWKTKGAEEPEWPAGGEPKSATETV